MRVKTRDLAVGAGTGAVLAMLADRVRPYPAAEPPRTVAGWRTTLMTVPRTTASPGDAWIAVARGTDATVGVASAQPGP